MSGASADPRSAPWAVEAGDVVREAGTDAVRGLASDEAAARLRALGPNLLEEAPTVPAWRRLAAQFADPLVYLLVGAIAIALAAWVADGRDGLPYDAIVIAAIVVLNGLLGYVQEARAEKAVAALQRLAETSAEVVRDGRETRVPARDVVPGDVLLLGEGDAVSADGRLLETASLTVAEASLTGESEPVLKQTGPIAELAPLGDRVNMVFKGTAVARGRGRVVVTATGMGTEMGTIALLLAVTEERRTPLSREVDRLGRALGFAVVVIAAVVVLAILLTAELHEPRALVDVLLIGVSLAVAAVPEGLPAVLSVVLALGVQRMARRRAIVKKLSSVETLGSASVVCSDKTGTLTRNEMTIERIATGSGEVEVTGDGYRPEGELRAAGRPLDDAVVREEVRAVLAAGSMASNATLLQEGGTWTITGDPTDAAFVVAEAKIEGLHEAREARFDRVGEIPFTSERRLMTTLHADIEGDLGTAAVTKGAPDVLLARCTAERVAGEVRSLSEHRRGEVLSVADRFSDAALRSLAVGYRPLPHGAAEDESIETELVLLGIVGMRDPPRSEARAAIAEAREAGIRVIVITGDHPRTAARIAMDLGVLSTEPRVLTGAELDRLDDGSLREAIRETSVCARVAPEHKLRIVNALQAEGSIVAMTGDGVNDAPALKSADIGVAMGLAGTDVAKEASDMVLADDNFATIVAAVREGRGIFANIRKFLRFLLSSNMGEVLTMFLGVVLASVIGLDQTGEAVAVPLLATQILWINLLTDSAPALALGVDPPPADVMLRRPRRLQDRIVDRRMWVGVFWVGLVMALVTLIAIDRHLPGGVIAGSGGIDEARTMGFTTLVVAQLFNCLNARSDRVSAFRGLFANRWLWAAIAVSLGLQAAVVQVAFLNEAFGTTPLSAAEWLECVALASLVLWAAEAKKLLERALTARAG